MRGELNGATAFDIKKLFREKCFCQFLTVLILQHELIETFVKLPGLSRSVLHAEVKAAPIPNAAASLKSIFIFKFQINF
jgi:hypothetical protein